LVLQKATNFYHLFCNRIVVLSALTWRNFSALSEGISSESGRARADGVVVHDLAVSSYSTSANARILTLLLDTGKMGGALSIDDTLWSAEWWPSGITWQAGAGFVSVDNLAFGVGATW